MMGFSRTVKNIGGRASSGAQMKAVETSLGSHNYVKHRGRGSSAGLNAQKTARLQPNGAGYANEANHISRNRSYSNFPVSESGALFKGGKTMDHLVDLRPPKYLFDR